MKNTSILCIASIAILVFSSCKKDNSPTTPVNSSSLPKTYTENVTSASFGNSITTYNLNYDGSNRLVSLIAATLPGVKELYKYNVDGSFSLDEYDDGTNLSIHENFFLNSYKLVDSTFQYNDTQDTTTEKYYYNGSKQLLAYTEYNYSKLGGSTQTNVTTYTYDNNGNVTKATDFNGVTSYTYTNLTSPLYIGPDFFSHTKNLIQTTSLNSGGSTETVTDSYTFDSSNRLITDKAVASTGDVLIKSYTY
jgi:YD repeat-containing protein